MELIPKEELLNYLKKEMELPEYSRLYRHVNYMRSVSDKDIYNQALKDVWKEIKRNLWDISFIYTADIYDLLEELKSGRKGESHSIWQRIESYLQSRKKSTKSTKSKEIE